MEEAAIFEKIMAENLKNNAHEQVYEKINYSIPMNGILQRNKK